MAPRLPGKRGRDATRSPQDRGLSTALTVTAGRRCDAASHSASHPRNYLLDAFGSARTAVTIASFGGRIR